MHRSSKSMGKLIKFPGAMQRVGTKYRKDEIARLNELLRVCDEDMQTLLEQIDQLQDELQSLTGEYEVLLTRLNKLIIIEDGDKND